MGSQEEKLAQKISQGECRFWSNQLKLFTPIAQKS
jgi:hypothetical protein